MAMLPPPGKPHGRSRAGTREGARAPAPGEVVPTPRKPTRSHRATMGPLAAHARGVSAAAQLAFAQLETELGGRERLTTTLLGADLPPHLQRFTALLIDPANDLYSLAEMASVAAITLTQLQNVFVEARRLRGLVLATDRIMTRAPDIADAVMADATPGWRSCWNCLGLGSIDPAETGVPQPCPECRGRGQVYHRPEHEVQKTALKLSGLLTTAAGVNVTNVNANLSQHADVGFDRLVTALDTAIYGSARDRLVSPPEPGGGPSGPAGPADED